MSDNKNLGDDLDDMLDDAKKGARDFADETKRAANDFSNSFKKESNAFENDFTQTTDKGKNIAIIAHITLIGWIVAIVMNSNPKDEFASFYIRQMLGLMIIAFILSFIPFVGWILNIGILVLWILSLIGAVNGEKKLTPGVGVYFQDWFKSM